MRTLFWPFSDDVINDVLKVPIDKGEAKPVVCGEPMILKQMKGTHKYKNASEPSETATFLRRGPRIKRS